MLVCAKEIKLLDVLAVAFASTGKIAMDCGD